MPVCPHAGGVGLSEMVQHLQLWDYICVSGTTENRLVESGVMMAKHFRYPFTVKKGRFTAPKVSISEGLIG